MPVGRDVEARRQIIEAEYQGKKGVWNGTKKETRKAFQYVKPVLLNPGTTGVAALGYGAFRATKWLMKITRLDRVFATAMDWSTNNPITKWLTFGREFKPPDVFMEDADSLFKGGSKGGSKGGDKKKDAGHH